MSVEELQTNLYLLTEAYQSLELSINIRNNKIIYQSAPGNIGEPPDIKISGASLEVVEHIPYI